LIVFSLIRFFLLEICCNKLFFFFFSHVPIVILIIKNWLWIENFRVLFIPFYQEFFNIVFWHYWSLLWFFLLFFIFLALLTILIINSILLIIFEFLGCFNLISVIFLEFIFSFNLILLTFNFTVLCLLNQVLSFFSCLPFKSLSSCNVFLSCLNC
jgi:hypothetical protein